MVLFFLAMRFELTGEVSSTTSERRALERRSAKPMNAVNEAKRSNLTLSANKKEHLMMLFFLGRKEENSKKFSLQNEKNSHNGAYKKHYCFT